MEVLGCGDVLKLLSWTGSFVILARGHPGTYFLTELIGGTCLLGTTVVAVNAVNAVGVAGVDLGDAITYAIYPSVVWVAVRPIVRMPVTSDLVAGIALVIGWRTIRSGASAPRPGSVPPIPTGSSCIPRRSDRLLRSH